ncbi:unnamed protein product, partial [Nesidiocoris tenuis]
KPCTSRRRNAADRDGFKRLHRRAGRSYTKFVRQSFPAASQFAERSVCGGNRRQFRDT